MKNLLVIKLGGSLMRSTELSYWLDSIVTLSNNTNVVIVPGGGEFADTVRRMQKTHQFDDLAAHRMALLAMCQYGYLLAGINKQLKIIEDIDLCTSDRGKNLPLIWLPTTLINDQSDIPASWDFTSDSIALWLATKISASKLLLVKSRDLNSDKASIRNHIKNNNLDKGFQELSDNYSGEILFFEKSQFKQLNDIQLSNAACHV